MNEWRFGTRIPHGFEKIQCADRIDVEIIKRPAGSQMMARLRSCMNDCVRGDLANGLSNSCPVADIDFAVAKPRKLLLETFSIPNRILLRPKKIPAHIVVETVPLPALSREKCD